MGSMTVQVTLIDFIDRHPSLFVDLLAQDRPLRERAARVRGVEL
jgi:hypothetical protein